MESITSLLSIALGAILVNNFVLSQFLGICPFLGVSKKVDTAVGMGIAVTFVMGLASAVCYVVNALVLIPLDLEYMQTVAFILVIAALVQLLETALRKYMPPLYNALGIYLPLITTNCAVLGVTMLVLEKGAAWGFHFDGWADCFDFDKWMQAFRDCGLDPAFYASRQRPMDEVFPWDHIGCGTRKEHLKREWERSREAAITPDCMHQCAGCGASALLKGGKCHV